MRLFFTIFLLSSILCRAQTEYFNSEESKFDASELIIGKWFLDKVEIIGLNNNDSTTIVSKENGKTSLVFTKEKVESFHDTTEYRYYKPPGYVYNYEILSDSITNWSEIHLLSKRKKETVESFVLVSISFEQLVYETFDSGIGLEKKSSKTRYYFTRHHDVKNPFIGKWLLSNNTAPMFKDGNDSTYTLQPFSDSLSTKKKENSITQCEIEFNTSNTYSYTCYSLVTGIFLGGNYMIDLDRKKLLFISKEVVVYDYLENSNKTITLRFDQKMSQHYSK